MKNSYVFVSILVVLALLVACGQTVVETAILTVGGQEYTQSDLEALGTISVDYTDKNGETTTYVGILLANLLEDAGLASGETVTFTATDDYQADIPFADALACTNCIVAFDDGSLRTVMPEHLENCK